MLIDEGQDLVRRAGRTQVPRAAGLLLAGLPQPAAGADPAGQLAGWGGAGHTSARRIIWAYDEAQSLDRLAVPKARELFGEELGQILTGGTQYKGGIKKNEVMKRCYRTPGPVLVAAHTLGMGLLRHGGMVAGLDHSGWVAGHRLRGRGRTPQRPHCHHPEDGPRTRPTSSRGFILDR